MSNLSRAIFLFAHVL